jgi:hypothetical protein
MKTARLLLVITGFGALSLGLGFAEEPPKLPNAHGKHTIAASAEPEHAGEALLNRPHSLLNNNGHVTERSGQAGPLNFQPKRAQANENHSPALKNAPAAANRGSTINVTKVADHATPPPKLPVASGNAPALSEEVHAQKNATATVGGLRTSTTKTSVASLNGTAIKGKSW